MDSRSPVYPPSSYPNFSSFSFPPQQPVTEQTHFEKSLPSFRVELAAAEAAQNYSRRRSSVYRVAGEYYYTQSDPIPFTGSQNLAKFHDLPFPNYNIGGEGLIRDDVKNYNRGVTDGFREVQYTTPPSAKHDFQTFLEPSNTGNTQHSYPDYIPSTQQSSCHGPPPGNSAYSNYFRNSQYSQSAAQDHSGNRSMQGLRIDTFNASPSIPTSSVRASPISQFPIHSTGSHPSFPAFNSTLGNSFRGYGLSPSTSTSLSATTSRGPSRNSNYSPSEISSPTFSPGQSHFEVSRNGGAFNCNPANISPGIESTALDFAKEQERYRYDQENHSRGGRSYQRMQGEEEREEKEQSVSISRLSKPKKNIHDSKKRSTRDEDDYQESSSTPSPTHHSPSYLQPHTQPDRNQSSSPLSSFGETPSPPSSPTRVKLAKKTRSSTNNTPRSTRLAGLKNVFRPSPVSMLASASETTLHQKNKRAHGGRGDGIEVDWSQMITKKSRGRRVQVASGSKSKENDDEEDDDEEEEEEKDVKGKGKKSFICKVPDCGKQFKRSEHLKRHVRSIHTNDRPYQCKWPECLKKFSRHDNLSQHLRVHRVEGQTDEEFSDLVRKAFGDGEED